GLQALEGPPDPLQGLVALVVLLDQLVGLAVQLVELILEAGGGGGGGAAGGPSCTQRGQVPVLLSSRLQWPDTGWVRLEKWGAHPLLRWGVGGAVHGESCPSGDHSVTKRAGL